MASSSTQGTATLTINRAEVGPVGYCTLVTEVVLRFLLLSAATVAVSVMVSSRQTRNIFIPFPPFQAELPEARFNKSPAFIYFVVAISVIAVYSLITTLISLFAICKRPKSLYPFVIFDVPLLAIVSTATGVAGAVAYLGLKGDDNVGWRKICDTYDDFCRHIGASVFLSLFASIVLVLLVMLSIFSLFRKIPK